MKSSFLGSAIGVLLVFSVISYSKTFIQGQNRNQSQQSQTASQQSGSTAATTQSTNDTVKPEVKASEAATVGVVSADGPATVRARLTTTIAPSDGSAQPVEPNAAPAQTYTATAYSLRGRTASGRPVSRGLIAADPAFLPLGTRVRLEAGSHSGEYLVADTGGAVKGRRIDIWTPTSREAMQFGRRPVKLTVLSLGVRRARAARQVRSRRA